MRCYEIDLSNLLKITMLNKSEFVPPQKHITRYTPEYILYVVEKGRLYIEHNGEAMELTEGDVCLFDKGEFQKPLEATECTFWYVHFQTSGFDKKDIADEEYCKIVRQKNNDFVKTNLYSTESYDHIKVLLKQRFNMKDKSVLNHIIGILKENTLSYANNSPEWRMKISYEASQLLLKLEGICLDTLDKSHHGKNGVIYDTVNRIVDYVQTHYRENFGSAEIERGLLINFDYANRIFKKQIGCSIIKYRNKLRINTAKTLLQEKTFDVIATEVGFNDRYYFSRCFKSFEGMSPEKYRDMHRKGIFND